MGKKINYYNFAENDFDFLQANMKEGRVSNAMCSCAQNICERYLKSVVEDCAHNFADTDIMKTHSLKKIKRFIENYLPEFKCDWKTVIQADGYYFSARYPGEDSFFVEKDDVDVCWAAVQETKKAADRYFEKQKTIALEETEMHSVSVAIHKKALESGMSEDTVTKRQKRSGR